MTEQELRRYAMQGAKLRLAEAHEVSRRVAPKPALVTRRPMSARERREVSRRMTAYWAAKRAAAKESRLSAQRRRLGVTS